MKRNAEGRRIGLADVAQQGRRAQHDHARPEIAPFSGKRHGVQRLAFVGHEPPFLDGTHHLQQGGDMASRLLRREPGGCRDEALEHEDVGKGPEIAGRLLRVQNPGCVRIDRRERPVVGEVGVAIAREQRGQGRIEQAGRRIEPAGQVRILALEEPRMGDEGFKSAALESSRTSRPVRAIHRCRRNQAA